MNRMNETVWKKRFTDNQLRKAERKRRKIRRRREKTKITDEAEGANTVNFF